MNYSKRAANIIKRKLFPLSVCDLRSHISSPMELSYLSRSVLKNDRILLNVPISKGRAPVYSNLDQKDNPFVKTMIQVQQNKATSYENSALKDFYDSVNPRNSSEVFGIDNSILKELPSYQYLYPWMGESFDDILIRRRAVSKKENLVNGDVKLSVEEMGHTDFGPVTNIKGAIEFQRVSLIYNSIKDLGYQEKPKSLDGGIRGYFLIDDQNNDWCFMITAGKHRAYALAALGHKELPVIIDLKLHVLKRWIDVDFWPQIRNSVFSKNEARFIFQKVLKGKI